MIKNNIKRPVLLNKRVKVLKSINKRWAWRIGRLYYLCRSNLFMYKFNLRFFKFPMHIFRYFALFFKNFRLFIYTYKNLLISNKYLYGNSERVLSIFDFSDDRYNFFYLSKRNLRGGVKAYNLQHLFNHIHGLTFFYYHEPLCDLTEGSDFFYKGSLYDTVVCDLDDIAYEKFAVTYNFDHISELNLFFITEFYKINILLTLNKLINLYF